MADRMDRFQLTAFAGVAWWARPVRISLFCERSVQAQGSRWIRQLSKSDQS